MAKSSMRLLLCFGLILIALSPALLAGDLEFEASTAFLSHFMWRGIRFSEGGVFQPSLTVGYQGFSANIWGNYSFDRSGNNTHEIDFTASFAGKKDKIGYAVGVIHYGVYKDLDSDEIYTSLSHNNFLKPTFKAYFDVNKGKGAYLQVGLEPSVPLGKEASLNFKSYVGYVFKNGYMGVNDAGREFSNLYNAEFTTSLTLPLGKGFSLEPMVGYSTALSQNARQAIKNASVSPMGETLYGGATLTYSF
jgi:hypothetical protein